MGLCLAVEEFGKYLKAALNEYESALVIWIGSLANSKIDIAGIKWRNDQIRYLGIDIGTNREDCNKLNWTSKLEAFQKLLDVWKTKYLTLYSKVSFSKTHALSQIIYSALNLPIPPGFSKKLEVIMYNFIWGKRDKICRRSMICNHEEGGINMIDIDRHFLALKASWVSRIKSSNKPWNILF